MKQFHPNPLLTNRQSSDMKSNRSQKNSPNPTLLSQTPHHLHSKPLTMTNFNIQIISDTVCPVNIPQPQPQPPTPTITITITYIMTQRETNPIPNLQWCFVGYRRLSRAITAHKASNPADTFSLHWKAFYLNPAAAAYPGVNKAEMYAQKFGAERRNAIFSRLAAVGEEDGIHFSFGGNTGRRGIRTDCFGMRVSRRLRWRRRRRRG